MVAAHINDVLLSCLDFDVHHSLVRHNVYRYRMAKIEWVSDICPLEGTTERIQVTVTF